MYSRRLDKLREAHQKALLDFRRAYLDLVKAGEISEDTNGIVKLVNEGDQKGPVQLKTVERGLDRASDGHEELSSVDKKDKKG